MTKKELEAKVTELENRLFLLELKVKHPNVGITLTDGLEYLRGPGVYGGRNGNFLPIIVEA